MKKIGRCAVSLVQVNGLFVAHRVLVAEECQLPRSRVYKAIRQIQKSNPLAKVDIVNKTTQGSFKKIRFAWQVFKRRDKAYECIVLLSLSNVPLIVASLLGYKNVFLFNQWDQWWLIRIRHPQDHLLALPYFFLSIIFFIFLLICACSRAIKKLASVNRNF